MRNNKFFKYRSEAKAFQAEHGGVIYSCTPRSKTKMRFCREMSLAYDLRKEVVSVNNTPWCVAWE